MQFNYSYDVHHKDAHCEATKDWIEPLLSRIEEDRTAVLVPIIDVIEATNMAYSTNGNNPLQTQIKLFNSLFLF